MLEKQFTRSLPRAGKTVPWADDLRRAAFAAEARARDCLHTPCPLQDPDTDTQQVTAIIELKTRTDIGARSWLKKGLCWSMLAMCAACPPAAVGGDSSSPCCVRGGTLAGLAVRVVCQLWAQPSTPSGSLDSGLLLPSDKGAVLD